MGTAGLSGSILVSRELPLVNFPGLRVASTTLMQRRLMIMRRATTEHERGLEEVHTREV